MLANVRSDLDIITMYEAAWKQQPGNEDLGAQTFSANARTGNWKSAQQACDILHYGCQVVAYRCLH